MKTDQIVMCVVALLLGMLLANMLKNVCGCKIVEGQGSNFGDYQGAEESVCAHIQDDGMRQACFDKEASSPTIWQGKSKMQILTELVWCDICSYASVRADCESKLNKPHCTWHGDDQDINKCSCIPELPASDLPASDLVSIASLHPSVGGPPVGDPVVAAAGIYGPCAHMNDQARVDCHRKIDRARITALPGDDTPVPPAQPVRGGGTDEEIGTFVQDLNDLHEGVSRAAKKRAWSIRRQPVGARDYVAAQEVLIEKNGFNSRYQPLAEKLPDHELRPEYAGSYDKLVYIKKFIDALDALYNEKVEAEAEHEAERLRKATRKATRNGPDAPTSGCEFWDRPSCRHPNIRRSVCFDSCNRDENCNWTFPPPDPTIRNFNPRGTCEGK